ncbi:MAG TPA: Ig-like domain-containing protein [Nannocystaceae bacterium]|nr:Ig-like domain-containing protein [Nannocystaceae bacterium]
MGLLVSLASLRVEAGEPTDAVADPGIGQSRGMPVLPPADRLPITAPPRPLAIKHGVVFVNFDGITLQQGGDNSQMNISEIFPGDFEPYGGDETARAAVMAAVKLDWQAYDVEIVDERPESGDYTMNVTTPTNPLGGGVLGIAPLDCFDMFTHNNITFAFHGANDGFPAPVQATTIGQEVAHSFGMEHVDDPTDIMNPSNSGGDPSFKDECIPVVAGGTCAEQHLPHCPDGMSQNAHRELLELFGTSAPDTVAPTVTITSPANGAEFGEGAEFVIEAVAIDDRQIGQLQLYDGDEKLQTKIEEPYTWEVYDIPEGYYRFRVVATDPAGNEAESNLVTVIVGDPEVPEEDDGFAEEGDDGSGTGDDPMGDDDGGDQGCGCATAPQSGAFGLLGLVVLARSRRRLRRASAA